MARVLLIEDDPDLSDLMAELLASRGHEVRLAPCGSEALAALEREPRFDLALLDWTLPDLPAEEVGARLRVRGVPIVIASAREGLEGLAAQLGARALLPKPFPLERLYRTIEEIAPVTRTAAPPPGGATPP